MDYFWIGVKLIICNWVDIIKLKTFISYASFNFDFYFLPNFAVFLGLFGPNWAILEVRGRLKNCCEFYSCSWTTFISFNSDFWFFLKSGVVFLFWVLMDFLGVILGFKNCFGVSSYRLITFVILVWLYKSYIGSELKSKVLQWTDSRTNGRTCMWKKCH